MKKSFAIITLIAMSVSITAFAADNMMDSDHMSMMVDKEMKMMGTNSDGMVTKDDYMSAQKKMFDEADANHDGMLSKQEIMDMKMKHMKEMGMMKDATTNNDGKM